MQIPDEFISSLSLVAIGSAIVMWKDIILLKGARNRAFKRIQDIEERLPCTHCLDHSSQKSE